MKLLCSGDSLVNGFPFPRSDSFPSIIARETGIEVRNIGMNGIIAMDTAHHLAAELRKAERSDMSHSGRSDQTNASCHDSANSNNGLPDAVLISCGSNDFMLGMSGPVDVCSDVKAMCAEASARGVNQIYVCSPPLTDPAKASRLWMPGVSYERVNEDLRTYADLLRDFAEEASNNVSEMSHDNASATSEEHTANIKFIDIQQAYKLIGEYYDGVHPTRNGYRFIAETICKELIPNSD